MGKMGKKNSGAESLYLSIAIRISNCKLHIQLSVQEAYIIIFLLNLSIVLRQKPLPAIINPKGISDLSK